MFYRIWQPKLFQKTCYLVNQSILFHIITKTLALTSRKSPFTKSIPLQNSIFSQKLSNQTFFKNPSHPFTQHLTIILDQKHVAQLIFKLKFTFFANLQPLICKTKLLIATIFAICKKMKKPPVRSLLYPFFLVGSSKP